MRRRVKQSGGVEPPAELRSFSESVWLPRVDTEGCTPLQAALRAHAAWASERWRWSYLNGWPDDAVDFIAEHRETRLALKRAHHGDPYIPEEDR